MEGRHTADRPTDETEPMKRMGMATCGAPRTPSSGPSSGSAPPNADSSTKTTSPHKRVDAASADPANKWYSASDEAIRRQKQSNDRPRAFAVPSAPVFYPTAKEWAASPLKYIESIRAMGEEWGIVKIVPPSTWDPGFHIDQETFRFETRIQKLNSIDGSSRRTVHYLDQLELFHEQSGTSFTRVPIIDNKPLDLYLLRKEVEKKGGPDAVSKLCIWNEVSEALGADNEACLDAPYTARMAYMQWIHPYEEYVRVNLALIVADPSDSEGEVASPATPVVGVKAPKVMGMGRMVTATGRMMKRIAGNNEDEEEDRAKVTGSAKCQICGDGKGTGRLLKCDECKLRFHMRCLDPPMTTAPNTDWYCALCLKTHGDDFGFVQEGSLQTLAEFQKVADDFKREYFTEKRKRQGIEVQPGNFLEIGEFEMEEEFWKLVEEDRFNDGVEVQYGADLHSSLHGSGFPHLKDAQAHPYSKSAWNLNNLPVISESLFCNIRNDISGMMVPWLYVGMSFSAFCWHTEDHYTYSINYNHIGDTKTWYGIPASDAVKFEVLMKKKVPELFETNPDLLFHLTTIISPRHLQENMVKVCSVDQRAGEFVVTFPRAYHAGFNQGLNFAEAVNFALPNWLPYGLSCVDRYIRFHKQPVFSHEELVIATALRDKTIKTCLWLKPELEILCGREIAGRNAIRVAYREHLTEILETVTLKSTQDIFCAVCRAYCFCTSVGLACSESEGDGLGGGECKEAKVVCYRHVEQLKAHCECLPPRLIMRIRYADEEFLSLKDAVFRVANIPVDWLRSYELLLRQYHRPPLKELQKLMAAADRMASTLGYALEESIALRGFVLAAEDWVAKARKLVACGGAAGSGRRISGADAKGQVAGRMKGVIGSQHRMPSRLSSVDLQPHIPSDRTLESIQAHLRAVDELPFECPEIETLQGMANAGESFQSRILSILSVDPLSLEEVEASLADLTDTETPLQVVIECAELLEEARQDLIWISAAQETVDNPCATFDELDDAASQARTFVHQKDHSGIQSSLSGFNALKKKKASMVMDLRRKRSRGEEWMIHSCALLKQKSMPLQELKQLLDVPPHQPVVVETFKRLKALLSSAQDIVLALRSLVQSAPDLDADFSASFSWDLKPTVSAVTSKLKQVHEQHECAVKIDEVEILEGELKKVEDWAIRCRRLFPKAPVPQAFSEVLRDVKMVLKSCSNPSDMSVFCFCRRCANGFKAECDICHVWYHGTCINLSKKDMAGQSNFICPLCDIDSEFERVAKMRPSLDQLMTLLHEGVSLPIIPDELDSFKCLVDSLGRWRLRITSYLPMLPTLCEDSDLISLRDEIRCLEGFPIELSNAVADTLRARLVELHTLLLRHGTPSSEGTTRASSTSGGVISSMDEEELYCVCRRPANDAMIACDLCEGWFHFGCVGLSVGDEIKIDSYKCPVCAQHEMHVPKKIVLKLPKITSLKKREKSGFSGSSHEHKPKKRRISATGHTSIGLSLK
ncbi:hypothetical protein BC830DRAFT_1218369 [Chytriomyces sp. MP71]|nr:hypothetical protein BC830DRAFT_1218369 [Chytriomyces sp. MP71]